MAPMMRVWGVFYRGLCSLFCIWGAISLLTSPPFDAWWHNAYGMDVAILSPPHTLLAMGMIFLQFGACVSICQYLNAGLAGGGTERLQPGFLGVGVCFAGLKGFAGGVLIFSGFPHNEGLAGRFFIIYL